MKTGKLKLLVALTALLMLGQTAAFAAEAKNTAPVKAKYKKVTGEVISASPSSIVIKSKTKGPMTMAVTDRTDVINGKSAKTGDRAVVNYRMDKAGNTATRIEVLTASAKAAKPKAAPAAASKAP